MRNWLKTTLFVSVFSPALLSLAYVKYESEGLVTETLFYALAGVFGTAFTTLILAAIKRSGETIAFSAKKIESNDSLMLGVVSTYFIPFLTKAADITPGVAIALMLMIAGVMWFTSSLPPHPVLRVLSFRFYKVEAANGVVYTLVSQRELLDPKHVRRVKRISGSMLVEIP